jgi:hypothetical protein
VNSPFEAKRVDDDGIELVSDVRAFLELFYALSWMDAEDNPDERSRRCVAAQATASSMADAIERVLRDDDIGGPLIVSPAARFPDPIPGFKVRQRLDPSPTRHLCEGLRDLSRWGRVELASWDRPDGAPLPNLPSHALWEWYCACEPHEVDGYLLRDDGVEIRIPGDDVLGGIEQVIAANRTSGIE